MIWTFIFILVVILGIIGIYLFDKWELVGWIGLTLTAVGGLILVIAIAIIIGGHLPSYMRKTLNNFQHQRVALIDRYESCNQADDLVIISEIEDFNAKIENGKYDLNNPWTSWLVSPVFNEIETIDRDTLNRKPLEIEVKENNS